MDRIKKLDLIHSLNSRMNFLNKSVVGYGLLYTWKNGVYNVRLSTLCGDPYKMTGGVLLVIIITG